MDSSLPSVNAPEGGVDAVGWTPLMRAAAQGDAPLTRALAAMPGAGAQATAAGGWQALSLAALYGKAECVDIALPFSDPQAATEDGKTALMWAARMGHAECVRRLAPASDPNARDKQGKSALFLALESRCVECIAILAPKTLAALPDAHGEPAVVFATRLRDASALRALLDARQGVFAPGEILAAHAVAGQIGFKDGVDLLGQFLVFENPALRPRPMK